MKEGERLDAGSVDTGTQTRIRTEDKQVGGFNIGANCGDVFGQTVAHANIHLVPRRSSDIADPRGVWGASPKREYIE
jgi:diadenosine tetraphosphate (Ap4A) HIT family hydrolase